MMSSSRLRGVPLPAEEVLPKGSGALEINRINRGEVRMSSGCFNIYKLNAVDSNYNLHICDLVLRKTFAVVEVPLNIFWGYIKLSLRQITKVPPRKSIYGV
jgi:hypothetical protein